MATEEQTQQNSTFSLHTVGAEWGNSYGQRLTITNRLITKLSFLMGKVGTPYGTISFVIRKIDDSLLASKLWGNSVDLPASATWLEVTLDTPLNVNEEVRILVEQTGGEAGYGNNPLVYRKTGGSVKANETGTAKHIGVWLDPPLEDCAYIYTYGASCTVTTQAVTGISGTVAVGHGNVTVLGNPNPTAHGVCWNTTGTPTTADSKTNEGAVSATGAFTTTMTDLTAGTKYHVRAYAINTEGTSYGSEVSFTTLTTGYPKVQII